MWRVTGTLRFRSFSAPQAPGASLEPTGLRPQCRAAGWTPRPASSSPGDPGTCVSFLQLGAGWEGRDGRARSHDSDLPSWGAMVGSGMAGPCGSAVALHQRTCLQGLHGVTQDTTEARTGERHGWGWVAPVLASPPTLVLAGAGSWGPLWMLGSGVRDILPRALQHGGETGHASAEWSVHRRSCRVQQGWPRHTSQTCVLPRAPLCDPGQVASPLCAQSPTCRMAVPRAGRSESP